MLYITILTVSRSVRSSPDSYSKDVPQLAPPLEALLQLESPSLLGPTKTESILAMR